MNEELDKRKQKRNRKKVDKDFRKRQAENG